MDLLVERKGEMVLFLLVLGRCYPILFSPLTTHVTQRNCNKYPPDVRLTVSSPNRT